MNHHRTEIFPRSTRNFLGLSRIFPIARSLSVGLSSHSEPRTLSFLMLVGIEEILTRFFASKMVKFILLCWRRHSIAVQPPLQRFEEKRREVRKKKSCRKENEVRKKKSFWRENEIDYLVEIKIAVMFLSH